MQELFPCHGGPTSGPPQLHLMPLGFDALDALDAQGAPAATLSTSSVDGQAHQEKARLKRRSIL